MRNGHVAQLVDGLPSVQELWIQSTALRRMSVEEQVCNSSTRNVEAMELEIQGHSPL